MSLETLNWCFQVRDHHIIAPACSAANNDKAQTHHTNKLLRGSETLVLDNNGREPTDSDGCHADLKVVVQWSEFKQNE